MSSGFDPYHQWLGVPSHEQPANYYRLLGLEPFESDLDAIARAADQRIKYVRDIATAEQRKQAREILEQISVAKHCLLIAEQKLAYDAGLRAGQATRYAKPTEPLSKTEKPSAAQVTGPASDVRTAVSSRPKAAPAKSKQPMSRLIVFVPAIGLVVASGLGWVYLRSHSGSTKQVAGNSKSLKTPDVLEQSATTPSPPSTEATAEPVRNTEVQISESNLAEKDVPATVPSLPEFVSRIPEPLPTKDDENEAAEPIEQESQVEAEVAQAAPPESETADESKVDEIGKRGGLLREVWINVTGNTVADFVQYVVDHPDPNQTETIDRFEPPEDFGDQYGQRLRGYLHPSTTGSYEFSIRANAEGWLFVSTDATPENKRRVEPETKIELEAGHAYYVEVFHKESTGRDYVSIGWKLPDGTEEKPIPGERLSVEYRIAPPHETEFVVLTPLSAESSSGAKLDVLDEGVIVAADAANDETYRLKFESKMETITAIRLEAIPHESLPAAGPGRGIGGRFALTDLSASVTNLEAPATLMPVTFASAVDSAGHDLRRLVDGDEKTVWRAGGRGEPTAATLMVRDPGTLPDGAILTVELRQREVLGRFRLLATSAPHPQSASRPAAASGGDTGLYSLFVNLGGDDFTTPDGVRWRASKFFDNETFGHEGGRGVAEDLIANKVQGSAERGIAAFRAVVPAGSYDVTLYFCEYWSTTPSSRRFAIAAEQRVVAASFDLFQAAGGFAKPFVYPIRNVTVKDGRLDIEFRETSEGASTILNAIRIQQIR